MVSNTTIANAVSACKTLRSLRHSRDFNNEGEYQLFEIISEHANTLHTLKTCSWESAESLPTHGGVFADFTALTQLEVCCSDVVAGILPPNLCKLILHANAKGARSLMERMRMLATKLSKRSETDIKLHYPHFITGDPKNFPKSRRLPAIFAKSNLNMSLYVCPAIGNIGEHAPEMTLSNSQFWANTEEGVWVGRLDELAAALSEREDATDSVMLECHSQQLGRVYSVRKRLVREIKRMVGRNENLWKLKDDSADYMLPYLNHCWGRS
ncbi:hypothetical protein G6011_07895 [Alternaria panax]|uniref:Uncharacterized protein n=1 Tax=Alternaria panax TaxID=48097 RepID=A0AAD4I6H0_9PLEO|nr:hypothetical protein G6011_07895 [Alternaria panax]